MSLTIDIIYIDDDPELGELVQEYLEAKEVRVKLIHNPPELIPQLREGKYNLCLMDVKMPHKDGFELAQEIIDNGIDIPFLFLTGQTRKEDRIRGLKLGAEDYISKPFSLEELYLRIVNITKRAQSGQTKQQSEYALGQYTFNSDYAELSSTEGKVNLSTTEAKLLQILCENMNNVVSRKEILKSIWGGDDHYKSLSLNVYITKLRNHLKLEEDITILNKHGEGYKLIVK